MSLVCCLEPEEGCTCEKNRFCGGVHIINSECVPHASVQFRCVIHEIGKKRIVEVEIS